MTTAETYLADEKLVEEIAARDQTALAGLYSRYADILMGVAYRILQNRSDAEDLIHDVFLEVWNKAGNYDRSRGRVKTWLVLITRSRAVDRIRSLTLARNHAMAATEMEEQEPQGAGPDVAMDQVLVRAAAEKLDEPQRRVLHLNYFEGLSCQEIARQINAPLGTVKSRLRAAVKNLRAEFTRVGEST